MTLILGLETSCDETAASVVRDGRFVLSNLVATQHDLHERYHGVVPEIASRAHLENINPVVQEALSQAGVGLDDIDAIAVGNRPGLIGSLLVGVSAAKTLAWAVGKPLIGIDHVHAHLHAASLTPPIKGSGVVSGEINLARTAPAPFMSDDDPGPLKFPSLGLVVSGGHTSLYHMNSPTGLTLIGHTIDDAVGEAYDKAAVILRIGYPGGPRLDKLAQQGNPNAHNLPRSMLGKDGLDFSFSGLKTAVLYTVRGHPKGRGAASRFERSADDLTGVQKADIAASFQAAAIGAVIRKLERAVRYMTDQGNAPESLVIGGGVSANSLLRTGALELGEKLSIEVRLPALAYCLDNAAMIAGLAHSAYLVGDYADLDLPAVASGSC